MASMLSWVNIQRTKKFSKNASRTKSIVSACMVVQRRCFATGIPEAERLTPQLGHGGAKGLFFLGAEELLRQLEKVNISNNRKDQTFSPGDRL